MANKNTENHCGKTNLFRMNFLLVAVLHCVSQLKGKKKKQSLAQSEKSVIAFRGKKSGSDQQMKE